MDFGSWKDAKYAGEKIVLFEDFAKEFFPMNLTFAIELKVIGIDADVKLSWLIQEKINEEDIKLAKEHGLGVRLTVNFPDKLRTLIEGKR